tara:strand:+ start:238 stop:489 length:252 start_codon:yes stop_codon:yes gene_type:complete
MSEIIDFQETSTPKFDPNKKYTWSQDELFTLTGGQFGLLLNSLRAVVSTKEAQTIILASKAADLMEDVLSQNVEKGVVKEITE